MTPLPIDQVLPQIIGALRNSRGLVLVAPPGAGKTTRVPPAIVRAGLLSVDNPHLVMLQPRRVAARASAQRIAEENGWELGREVGYQIRFERRIGPETRIRVLTEGVLTRQLLDDPFLPGVGAVLLDEFHERNLNTDIAIALLREVQQTVRADLMLIVMSATLEAEPVAKFLGNCPIIRSEGRTFPVEVSYSPAPAGMSTRELPQRVADGVRVALGGEGDVLAFLPGAEEIRRTMRLLEPAAAAAEDLLVLPLHGSLPAEQQTLALRPANRRKVVLATNIAETSLTIDGVRTVVDSGFARVAGYDPRRGLDRLELRRISKASATQRAGRAGRTAPGRCLRLWSQQEDRAMAEFELPEIRRVDLCGTALALHAWGQSDVRAFGWYEPPTEEAVASAERLLEMLGALTAERNGKITEVGRRMVSLPTHPRLARLLLAAADEGLLHEGATIAALLSEKDILRSEPVSGPRQPKTQGPSDFAVRMESLARAEADRFAPHLRDAGIDPIAARQVAKARDDLLRSARRLPQGRGGDPEEAMLKLPLWAYPDRVCRRRGGFDRGVMVGGGGVRLAAESVVTQAEFFVALDARQDERSTSREAMVRIASAIQPEWLEQMFPQEVRRERGATFDEQRGRVVGRSAVWYRDLLVHEDLNVALDPQAAASALGDVVRPKAGEWFRQDESAASVLARVSLLREHMPEQPWPMWDDAELGDLLADAAYGKRSLEDVKSLPLGQVLKDRLAYPLDRLLEEHAPESIAVPTGNRIRVAYAIGQAPVLAVRLQELFGWTDTPRIAGGRVKVLMHLLGPNYRPVQITDDLRSFWSTTYFQVRKDLRVRYPKHSWPEDPLTAKPQAKGRSHK